MKKKDFKQYARHNYQNPPLNTSDMYIYKSIRDLNLGVWTTSRNVARQ
jgi:hypothetical protein